MSSSHLVELHLNATSMKRAPKNQDSTHIYVLFHSIFNILVNPRSMSWFQKPSNGDFCLQILFH